MKVLHLCTYLSCSKLYVELFEALSTVIIQSVFTPLRRGRDAPKIPGLRGVDFTFISFLQPYHRLFYRTKIRRSFLELEKSGCISETLPELAHAHTWFSDGGLAYELKRKAGVPYIISVRNTDLNIFLKYFLHLRPYAYEILKGASAVILLSSASKEKLESMLPDNVLAEITQKIYIVPNGIDSFWFKNGESGHWKDDKSNVTKVLFVGRFNANKNIGTLIKATDLLISQGYDLHLRLVGNYGSAVSKIAHLAKSRPYIEIVDKIEDLEVLRKQYQWADIFVMPSFTETFGLVYAEALSQGTPIICTKGQGFDGWFKPGATGFCVDPRNVADIAEKILSLKASYNPDECKEYSKLFDWKKVSQKLFELYSDAIRNTK